MVIATAARGVPDGRTCRPRYACSYETLRRFAELTAAIRGGEHDQRRSDRQVELKPANI
jgi:hypothetical protein